MAQIWKPLPGLAGVQVSNDGRIIVQNKKHPEYSFLRKAWGAGRRGRDGKRYLKVSIRGIEFYVHILVLLAFKGIKPKNHQTNHIDGDKHNNNIENLEYVTARENIRHSYAHGLQIPTIKQRTVRAKLSINQVKEILKKVTKEKEEAIAKEYGVTKGCISGIRTGARWGWIKSYEQLAKSVI